MSIIVFSLLDVVPGDPITYYEQGLMSERGMSADAARAHADVLRSIYGLDGPFVQRYVMWFTNFLRGNFGVSFNNFRPVSEIIGQRLFYSLIISSSALIFMYLVGVPLGIWTAYRQYKVDDYVATFFAFVGISIPNFFLALLLLVGLLFYFGVSPPQGLFSPEYLGEPWSLGKVLDMLRGLILPVLVIGTEGVAKIMRISRANMLGILQQDFIRTAKAKGLSQRKVLMKHAFRVAVNPLVSLLGMQFPLILSGEIVGSIVLGLPTMGPLLLAAIQSLDLYVSSTILMILGILLLTGNLLADILLAVVDPRITYD